MNYFQHLHLTQEIMNPSTDEQIKEEFISSVDLNSNPDNMIFCK